MAKMGSKDKMPTAGIPGGRSHKAGSSAPKGSKQGVGARGKATGAPKGVTGSRMGSGVGSRFGKC